MRNKKFYNIAFGLALFTILYNIGEGIISTYFGFKDGSLALFGFGTDSFIEVVSGIGIAIMIVRIQKNEKSKRASFEKIALKITGTGFYILVAALLVSSIYNIWTKHKPQTTLWGIIISIVSILVMCVLTIRKRKVGKELNSIPILADANCTLVCVYMSVILLISSGIYELFKIPYIDSLGTLGISWFAFKEGKECFEKAKGNEDTCCK